MAHHLPSLPLSRIAAATALCMASTAWAQTAAQPQELVITSPAPQQVSGLGDVPLSKAPFSGVNIDAQTLRDIGATRISDALRACAGRLRGSKQPLSSAAIFDIRTENLDQTADWLAEHRHNHSPGYLREQIEDTFPVRVTTLITSRITDQTIAVKPRPGDETSDPPSVLATAAEGPPTAVERLRMHLSWNSPWFRSAVRSAVALSLSIAVAKSVSLQHPFWIVLGTLSALRFDALGTGRTAKQALIGTTAGVALSAVCIQLFGGNQVIWWILFPIALFWAAYTPGTLSFAVGQAGFSFVVIVMFSILSPVRLDTAAARLIDVVLGLAISLVVSLLMWPRGVVETLYTRLREAMQAACDYYVASADWMAGGAVNDRLLAEYKSASESALDRAQEALDLSIAQRPPKAVALQRWTALANTVHHVDFASRLMPQAVGIIRLRGDQTPLPIQLSGPLMAGANNAREELMAATNAWCDQQPAFDDDSTAGAFDGTLPEFETAPTVRDLRQAIDDYLATPRRLAWHGQRPPAGGGDLAHGLDRAVRPLSTGVADSGVRRTQNTDRPSAAAATIFAIRSARVCGRFADLTQ